MPALIKCALALLLLLQAHVFAFTAPSVASTTQSQILRDTRCFAANKRENCPGKTAFKNTNAIGGVGGLNINPGKKAASASPKKTTGATNRNPSTLKSKAPVKKAVKSTSNVEVSDPTQTPWSTIILAFLIPWRNPNSLFLYMFLTLFVLGKINESKP